MRARPLAPHIQVYRPQINSVLSMFHRLTGIWLGIGSVFLVWWLVALALGPQAYASAQGFFDSWLGQVFLLGWSFAACLHLANGIRHLLWDLGLGFTLRTAYATGWMVIGGTLLLTIITWGLGYALKGH